MKHILSSVAAIFFLSSCNSFVGDTNSSVETPFGYSLDPEFITALGVSNALSKDKQLFDTFVEIVTTLDYISSDVYVDSGVLLMQIDGVLEDKPQEHKKLVNNAFKLIMKYLDNSVVDEDEIKKSQDIFNLIKKGLASALEHYILSNGEIISNLK